MSSDGRAGVVGASGRGGGERLPGSVRVFGDRATGGPDVLPAEVLPLVLVVDDDAAIQKVIAGALALVCRATFALDAASGLVSARAHRPDLIIVDLNLPDMPGDRLVSVLREDPDLRDIPILILTADGDTDRMVRLLEMGANDFARKPFLMAELRARVRNLLTTKEVRDLLNVSLNEREVDLMKLAEEVTEKNRALEGSLAALEEARSAAVHANQVKSSFLRMMSHELKTPIAALQLQVQLLQRHRERAHDDALTVELERIARSSQRLSNLIDTFLDWARVESGRLHPHLERFEVRELVDEIVEDLRTHAARKGVRYMVSGLLVDSALRSDRRVTRLLIVHVLERALQLTDRGTIVVGLKSRDDGIDLSATDHGIASWDEVSAELAPFLEENAPHRRGGVGSGLGLYVVRDIVRAIGGDLLIDAPGRTVTLRLATQAVSTEALDAR